MKEYQVIVDYEWLDSNQVDFKVTAKNKKEAMEKAKIKFNKELQDGVYGEPSSVILNVDIGIE